MTNNTATSKDDNEDPHYISVGDQIKNARLKANVTIEQLAIETKIAKRYIKAIEENNYQVLPAEVYLKGFFINLTEFFSLDTEELLQQFQIQKENSSVPFNAVDDWNYRKKEHAKQNKTERAKSKLLQSSAHLMNMSLWIASSLIIIIALLIIVMSISNRESEIPNFAESNNTIKPTATTALLIDKRITVMDLQSNDKIAIANENLSFLMLSNYATNIYFRFDNNTNVNVLKLLESGLYDFNGDTINDIEVRYESFVSNKSSVYFNLLNYQVALLDHQQIWFDKPKVTVNKEYTLLTNQNKANIVLYLKALQITSFISYNIDGERQNSKWLYPGEEILIEAKEHLEINLGNYRNLICVLNSIPIDLVLTDSKKFSITKIIKWFPNANNETKFSLVIKDYTL